MMKKNKKLIPKRRFKEFENDGEWLENKLNDGVFRIGDGLHGTPKYSDTGDVYFINGNNLNNGKILITEETKAVTENKQSKADKILDTDTILLSVNGTIGNLAFYQNEKVMLGKSVAYIKLKDYEKDYIYAYLQTPRIYNYFMNSLTGSTIKNLSLKTIRETKIMHPQLTEQLVIGDSFNTIDKLIFIQQKKINKIKYLKTAYLSDVFPKEGEKYPKKRFDGFTEPWEKKKLNEITNYLSSSLSAENSLTKGEYKLYDANGMIGYAKNGQQEVYISIIKDGSGVGRVRLLPENSIFIGTMGGILSKNESDVNYLYAFLQKFDFTNYIIGATIPHVYFRDYGESFSYHPGVEEQIKIGNFFKNLDAQIDIEERKLNKLEQLKQAYLNELFV